MGCAGQGCDEQPLYQIQVRICGTIVLVGLCKRCYTDIARDAQEHRDAETKMPMRVSLGDGKPHPSLR